MSCFFVEKKCALLNKSHLLNLFTWINMNKTCFSLGTLSYYPFSFIRKSSTDMPFKSGFLCVSLFIRETSWYIIGKYPVHASQYYFIDQVLKTGVERKRRKILFYLQWSFILFGRNLLLLLIRKQPIYWKGRPSMKQGVFLCIYIWRLVWPNMPRGW